MNELLVFSFFDQRPQLGSVLQIVFNRVDEGSLYLGAEQFGLGKFITFV